MASDDTLVLTTGGRAFSGWKSVSVERGLDQCAGSFDIGLAERPDVAQPSVPIYAGESCQVMVGDVPVITGFIDSMQRSLDANSHELRIAGRSSTADLVDCSAIGKTGQWRGLKIEQIAKQLADPFKIGVVVDVDVDTGKQLQSFALQEGETVYCAIERAARMRGLLLTSDAQGRLLITRPGNARISTALRLGENVRSIEGRVDLRDRFSKYVAKGQAAGQYFDAAGAPADGSVGKVVSQVSAIAVDPDVKRYRPLILLAECQDIAASLTQRVQWEASVRAARSLELEVTVSGWRHADGVWEPNRKVWVDAPGFGLSTDLLITRVALNMDDGGQSARLSLTRPDAYEVLPMQEAAAGAAAAYFSAPPKAATGS